MSGKPSFRVANLACIAGVRTSVPNLEELRGRAQPARWSNSSSPPMRSVESTVGMASSCGTTEQGLGGGTLWPEHYGSQVTVQAFEKLKPAPEQVFAESRYQNW